MGLPNCGCFRTIIYNDFRYGLTQQQYVDQLISTFGDEAPHQATVFQWFAEFNCGRCSLKDEFCEGRPNRTFSRKH